MDQNSLMQLRSYRVLACPENSVIPRTVYMELDGNWYVPQVDAQGSMTHVLDPRTAAIASIKRHTAFGEVLSAGLPSGLLTGFLESSSAESLASLSKVSCPWGYFSKRLDLDLGLIDFGKRWYDPQQARWTTLDPAGFIDGTNLYRFVRNNPLLYTDPDGQVAFVIPIFTATAVTWEGLAAVVAAVAAVLGAYQVYDAVGSSIEQQKEFELQQARAFGQDYKPKPLYTTTTEHKPKPKKEEEKDPEWDNGSGPNGVKEGIAEEVRKKRSPRGNRGKLSRLTGRCSPQDDAHHVFPQRFRKDFTRKGINIDDPKYLTWWERTSHQRAARWYNEKWKEYLIRHSDAGEAQILERGKIMMNEHGIPTNY